ncbi:MAG: OmpA family protein [Candidatus Korobacteraceae bacterium]|jgi:outer membrane protein OmpA-like peptidoglycan-associated protein
MKNRFLFTLPLLATLALPLVAQQGTAAADQQPLAESQTSLDANSPTANPDQQLELLKPDSREGFWGHMNPFARKKYVQRQLAPIRDRTSELDELTAINSRMLKDVDARATAGIQRADAHATLADHHAVDAANRAQMASQSAQQASTHLQSVSQVVQNLDQYQSASQVEIRFRPGAATLSKNAREALDQLAEGMKDQKGYVVEVQGFTPGRGAASIQQSQHLADSVVRYLVINHQIPVYRIYELGLGNARLQSASGGQAAKPSPGSRVEVTLLKNGVGELQAIQQAPAMSQPE